MILTCERKIRQAYPRDSQYLQGDDIPALRRTNYKVEYEIRTYTDVEEIKSLYAQLPEASLQEFYLAASEMQSGGDEFDYIFETAARMFPEDDSQSQCGKCLYEQGQPKGCRFLLAKAGKSAEADYARSAAALNKDYAAALAHLRKARCRSRKGGKDAEIEKVARMYSAQMKQTREKY